MFSLGALSSVFGDKDSKAVIEKYELFTDQRKLKAYVLAPFFRSASETR